MRRKHLLAKSAAFVFLAASLRAECLKDHDHRSSPSSGILVTDFTITGTQALSSDDISDITNSLIGSCFDDNPEELNERVRILFQDRGYFAIEIKNLRIKADDPIAQPKPVTLEADIAEGPRYRVAEIEFVGNHSFSRAELRGKFPLKKGDLFTRDKVASGLQKVRDLYVQNGFIEWYSIPNTQNFSNGTIDLSLEISEGKQFHMGKLEIFARKETAEKLRSAWELPEGAVFDFDYIDKYIGSNASLLPPDFNRQGVQLVRDCQDNTVAVRFLIDPLDPKSQSQPQEAGCESPDQSPK